MTHPGTPEHVTPPASAGAAELAPRPRTGTMPWALGFLAVLPLPMVNVIIAGVVQLIAGLSQRKHGGLAARNGIRAANWGLTQLLYPVLLGIVVAIAVATGTSGATGTQVAPVMEAILFTVLGLYLVVGILQLIYAIVGSVQASGGKAVRLPVVPFLRGPKD